MLPIALVTVLTFVPQVPVPQRIELHLPHPHANDWAGQAVAIEGTRVLVGVPNDDSPEGGNTGSARVFERSPDGSWSQAANLRALDRAQDDTFGNAVALAGDFALVGAQQDDGHLGAAYVFERSPNGSWSQAAKLLPSVRSAYSFGHDVALSGARALVGSHSDEDAGEDAGAAHVFERQPNGTWSEVAKLIASDAAPLDNFGIAVALDGDRALVGAWGKAFVGAAYVFERDGTGAWHETAKLLSGDSLSGTALFGQSVALSGERALVGDRTQGAAYVFERDAGGTWSRTARLSGSANAFFGYDVALDGARALVGAYWGPSARLFEQKPNGAWAERVELVHEAQGTDWFGYSVALSGDWIAVGAPRDSDFGTNTGSATVYPVSSPAAHSNPTPPGPGPVVLLPLRSFVPFDPTTHTLGLTGSSVPLYLFF
jgi:hypothetical protein